MPALLELDDGTIELEVDIAAGASSSVWDTASWDFDRWGADVGGDWVDVTCDISEVTLTAGADKPDGLLTAINATTGGITFHGPAYNPWAPPWGPDVLGPGLGVQILWRHLGDVDWLTAFYGVTDGWPYDRVTETAAVPILDSTGQLANQDLAELAVPQGEGEGISARIGRVLNAASWPNARRQIPTDTRPTIATTLGAAAWDMLQTAADTGLGLLWVTRTGDVAYLPVGQTGGWTPVYLPVTLTDVDTGDPAELCVVNFTNSDPEVVRNQVTIARAADPAVPGDTPTVAAAADPVSQLRYGIKTYDRDDLIHKLDAWSATVAAAVLLDGAWPLLHPEVAVLDARTDIRAADLLLGAEIGHVIAVEDSGQSFNCAVVGYQLDISHNRLSGSLVLSDVTRWTGYGWDMANWDQSAWGI